MSAPDRAPPVLVVAPLREELAALVDRLEGHRKLRRRGVRVHAGRLDGAPVHAAVLGDGAVRAAGTLDRLLEAHATDVRAVLVVGVAGALSPDLSACDVLAATPIEAHSAAAPAPDPDWLDRLPADAIRRGRLVSVDRVIGEGDAKRALAEHLGPTALAVDLESAALAEAAHRRGVRFLVLRAISDTRDESLPRFLAACFRPDGSVRRGRVLLGLARKPRRLRALLAVARRMKCCSRALADAATTAVACAPDR